MNAKVILFSILKDKVGASEISLELPENAKASELIDLIVASYPAVSSIKHLLKVSVNQDFAEPNQTIPAGAEIAVFPPVSGG